MRVRTSDRFYCSSGSPDKVTYEPVYDKEGRWDLKETGKVSVYDEIQSHKESVSIHSILDRYKNGDLSALDERQGFYGDVSNMPKTYAEMFQLISDGKNAFLKLPVEVRARFEHNFEYWMSTIGTDDWNAKMSSDFGEPESDGSDLGSDNSDNEVNVE